MRSLNKEREKSNEGPITPRKRRSLFLKMKIISEIDNEKFYL